MAKVMSKAMLNAAIKGMFNSNSWEPTGEECTLEEFWNAAFPGLYAKAEETSEVVAVEFSDGIGLRIAVPIKGSSKPMQLKLSPKSELEEGDLVKTASIKGIMLGKLGQEDIMKFDGELVEE